MTRKSDWSRWWMVVIYAVAMAWVESAAVYYLRSMIHRVDPYQPNPLPVVGGFAGVELTRELATLVMLFAVGVLAGRTWRARIGYGAVAFGVWDIFYYVFLKIICGWPHALLDWDILFLVPMPWWGPVLAPVLISLGMIAWGTLASQFEKPDGAVAFNWRMWAVNITGCALALYLFMADAIAAALRGRESIRTVLPGKFDWPWFGVALVMMAAPVIQAGGRLLNSGRATVETNRASRNPETQENQRRSYEPDPMD